MNSAGRLFCVLLTLGALVMGLLPLSAAADDSPAAIYEKRCSSCHGKDGSGKTTAGAKMHIPDLRSKAVREMSDAEMYSTIAEGTKHKNYPHAFLHTGMTEKQIEAAVAHVRTLK